MVEIIDHIDDTLLSCWGKGKFYGLCRLLKDDKGVVYPATYSDNKKVTPNDKFPIIWYHRLLNSESTEDDDLSYGRSKSVKVGQRIRTVVVVSFLEGETFIDDFINALPGKINPIDFDEDYKYIELSKEISLIRDVQSIWETEWGTAYEDKYQMRYNLYALEYDLEYVKCRVCLT